MSNRVTRTGHWLRKTHLDELPQFINILRGDMDLVGPRPEMASNVKTMAEQIPYYSLRMTVRPGVTGWAQVKYGYAVSQEDVTEKVRYDLYYIKHMSLWLDLKVLVDTVKVVLLSWRSPVKNHTPAGIISEPVDERQEINGALLHEGERTHTDRSEQKVEGTGFSVVHLGSR